MPVDLHEVWMGLDQELATASCDFLALNMSGPQALMLHGVLRLALRHPDIPPTVADAARELADVLAQKLAVLGPMTRTMCALNEDPTHSCFAA
jgi:hypothetical protein